MAGRDFYLCPVLILKTFIVDKDIYNIVSKHFRNSISEQDENYLQSWLKQSKENEQLFNELKKVWEITGDLKTELHPDVDDEWKHFIKIRGTGSENDSPKIAKTRKLSSLYKIAAVLIPAFIMISVVWYYLSKNDSGEKMVAIETNKTKKELLLSDGTKVWLNQYTIFSYPEKFDKNERLVNLVGEAYFEVAKKNDAPFIIKASNMEIVVVGTAFNVRALEQESIAEIAVTEGVVEIKTNAQQGATSLQAGEKATYNQLNNSIKKEKFANENFIGWKNKELKFKDTPLANVEETLNRYFQKKVKIGKEMEKCKFTGEFKNPQLEEILDIISISLGVTYQTKADTIYIRGSGCIN